MENNITTQIQKLVQKTVQGKINWTAVGQNNFRWTKQDVNTLYTTTLSKQILPPNISNANMYNNRNIFQFVIQTTNPNEIILQINTNIDPEITEVINELYLAVLDFSRKNSASIIDKLIEDL